MSEWDSQKLGNLVAICKGKLARLSTHVRDGYLPYLGASAIEGRIDAFAETSDAELAHDNDILMLWDGERSGLVGKGRQGVVASTVAKLTPKNGIESTFLFHALSSQFEWIQARRTGTGVPHVPKDLCNILVLNIPRSTSEQRAIAAILDAADKAIAKTEALIAKLKAVKQGLLRDLLTRGLDDNGELRDPEKHPEQFKDTPLGWIPKRWTVVCLKECADVLGGKRLPSGHAYTDRETGLYYLRVIDFYERVPDFRVMMKIEDRTFDALSRYEIRDGELFISIAGSLGYAGVYHPPKGTRTILTENAARIVPSSNVRPVFLALEINGPLVQAQIKQQKGISSGVPKLALFRIQNLRIVVPPLHEQTHIEDVIITHNRHIEAEATYLSKLKAIKKGLMQDLLTGRVRVKGLNHIQEK